MINEYVFFAVAETFFTKEMQKNNCDVVQMYKSIPKILKILRKLHYKIRLPGFKIWLNKVPNDIKDKKVCIVYASEYSTKYVEVLRQKTNAPIFFWYNNIVLTDGKFHDNININDFIPTSFDKNDCEKFSMFYNTQYYFSSIKLKDEPILYDAICICKDKGRAESLRKLEKYLNELGLKTYFHICKDSTSTNNSEIKYKSPIPYEEILKKIAQSKIIIDYTQENQEGITLRPLEAIFFKKKLITNNKALEKEKFYDKENFTIIDVDNLEIDIDFLQKPYKEINQNIVEYFDFKSWLKRFKMYDKEK